MKLPGASSARAAESVTLSFSIDCFTNDSETPKYSAIGESGQTISIENVEPGSYNIVAQAWDTEAPDVLLYKGEGTALVLAGETVPVSITLKYVGPEEKQEEENLPEEIVISFPSDKNTAVISVSFSDNGKSNVFTAETSTEKDVTVKNYYWYLDGKLLADKSGADKKSFSFVIEDTFYNVGVVVEFSDGSYDYNTISCYDYYTSKVFTSIEDLTAEQASAVFNENIKNNKAVSKYTERTEKTVGKGNLVYNVNFFDIYDASVFGENFEKPSDGNSVSSSISSEVKTELSTAIYPINILKDSRTAAVKTGVAKKTDKTVEIESFMAEIQKTEKIKVPVYQVTEELEPGWYYIATTFSTKFVFGSNSEVLASGGWNNIVFISEGYDTLLTQTSANIAMGGKNESPEVPDSNVDVYIVGVPEDGAFTADTKFYLSSGSNSTGNRIEGNVVSIDVWIDGTLKVGLKFPTTLINGDTYYLSVDNWNTRYEKATLDDDGFFYANAQNPPLLTFILGNLDELSIYGNIDQLRYKLNTIATDENRDIWIYVYECTDDELKQLGEVLKNSALPGKKAYLDLKDTYITKITSSEHLGSLNFTGIVLPPSIQYVDWQAFSTCSESVFINVDAGFAPKWVKSTKEHGYKYYEGNKLPDCKTEQASYFNISSLMDYPFDNMRTILQSLNDGTADPYIKVNDETLYIYAVTGTHYFNGSTDSYGLPGTVIFVGDKESTISGADKIGITGNSSIYLLNFAEEYEPIGPNGGGSGSGTGGVSTGGSGTEIIQTEVLDFECSSTELKSKLENLSDSITAPKTITVHITDANLSSNSLKDLEIGLQKNFAYKLDLSKCTGISYLSSGIIPTSVPIETLTIPSSVKYIDNFSLNNCKSLQLASSEDKWLIRANSKYYYFSGSYIKNIESGSSYYKLSDTTINDNIISAKEYGTYTSIVRNNTLTPIISASFDTTAPIVFYISFSYKSDGSVITSETSYSNDIVLVPTSESLTVEGPLLKGVNEYIASKYDDTNQ